MLINDLLDSSQIASGKLRLISEKVMITELVQSVVDILKFQAKKRSIEIRLINNIKTKLVIKTDPNRVRQILNNLVGNAIKFTENGTISFVIDEILPSNDFIEISNS